ncbi:uncharacterized protein [Dermacentor albipictus]|uniref:uncharacterized protein n=1 Tax=Dermacentor albipictus TaxID=60249 RepID=UPI0031FC742F
MPSLLRASLSLSPWSYPSNKTVKTTLSTATWPISSCGHVSLPGIMIIIIVALALGGVHRSTSSAPSPIPGHPERTSAIPREQQTGLQLMPYVHRLVLLVSLGRENEAAMGNAQRKTGEIPDEMTGLTEHQKKLVQATWRSFTSHNREYGPLVFLSLLAKHPEYLPMFRNFRGKSVTQLKDDPIFRAHGCSIGYHVISMVESLGDPAALEVLVRRNATEHLRRKGVKPHHFEVMGQCLVHVLQAREERLTTPEAIEGWGKFLALMVRIIKDVYEKAAAERAERGSVASWASDIDDTGFTSPYRSAEITSGSQRTGEGSVSTMTAGSPSRPPSDKIGAGRLIGASKKGGASQPHKLEDETPMVTPPAQVSPDKKHHDKP